MTTSELPDDQGTVPLKIDRLTAGGRGLGHHEGRVWFVTGGLPGDRALVRPVREHARFVEATVLSIPEPAPSRREPPCPLQPRCGGCPWMPLGEADQREWKVRLVRDALGRIGRIRNEELESIRTPGAELGYRNRAEFTVCWDGVAGPVIGLHGSDPAASIVPVDRCLLQTEAANRVLRSLGKLLGGIRPAASGDRPVDRIVIRRSEETGELLVGLHATRPGGTAVGDLAQRLIELHPEVRGVVQLYTPHGRRGGTRTRVAAGRGQIVERVAGFRFDLPATSFFQVNRPAARALLDLVVQMAPPLEGCNLLDLYGGVGLYALELLRRGAASATVCEADVEAVRCGRETAFRHRIRGIRYEHADVRRFLARLDDGANPQLVVLNPPRAGLGKGVAQAVRSLAAGRLIVISCDPPTLARDLATLCENGAYSVDRIVPLDLFPQTAHVEVVVSLSARPGLRAADRPRRRRGSSRRPTSG